MTNHFIIYVYFTLSALGLSNGIQNNEPQNTLHILIKGIDSDQGQVMIAIYDSEKGYMDIEKAYFKKSIPIRNKVSRLSIPNMPSGSYAVVCFHDRNTNQKLDKNAFGIPKEGYGFSNDAKGNFGPPKFEKSSFKLSESTQSITINMVYW